MIQIYTTTALNFGSIDMKRLIFFVIFLVSCGNNFDYETRHGINVNLGEVNRPSQELVELWTDQTLDFWAIAMKWRGCTNTIDGATASFSDDIILITIDGRRVWAYCDLFHKILVMGLGSQDIQKRKLIVRVEFMHELSHLIAYSCGDFADEKGSHKLFRDVEAPF